MDHHTNNDSNNIYYNSFGQISDLFSAPAIPKMVIVGMDGEETGAEMNRLQLFKDILVQALDNLFIIDFQEQFVPRYEKLPSHLINYRNHEVKETWMYKIRAEYPSILIDFRLMSMYDTAGQSGISKIPGMAEGYGDEILTDQIAQTKSMLSVIDGPVYLVWLAARGGLTSQRIAAIAKGAGIDKSTISVIDLTISDPQTITANLKPRIQECYEFSRQFYQNLSKKYKQSLGAPEKIQKFMQPWMCPVYYYFKLAVLEEFKGDFASSLKYYHTILAKFKEIIEQGNEGGWSLEWKYQMMNYLRNSADICFIRLSFLLFRMDQCGEAEFGLFRYFNFFGHGLNAHSERILWRYNMSRMFARLLGWSLIWSPKNGQLMRGPSNYFLYAVKLAKTYLKVSESSDVYQIQEMILKDLYDALEYAKMNSKLVYMTKYIEFMITEYTGDTTAVNINSLCAGWKVLEDDLLDSSIKQYRNQQSYTEAIKGELLRGIRDFSTFDDWCMMVSECELDTTTRRPSFNISSDFLFCCVGFTKRNCLVFEECEIELSVYTKLPMELESFDIIYSDSGFTNNFVCCTPGGDVYKFKPEKVGKLRIQAVKLNFSRPNLSLRVEETSLQHQQNSEKNFPKMSLEFTRKCQKTLKSMLQLRVEPLKPKVKITVQDIEGEIIILVGSEIEVKVTLSNETYLPCLIDLVVADEGIVGLELGPEECKEIGIKVKIFGGPLVIKALCKFNLELMDFRNAELCSFDPVQVLETVNFGDDLSVVDPFAISLLKDRESLLVEAKEDIEWISEEVAVPCVIRAGCSRVFKVKKCSASFKGSFRLLRDERGQIFQHEWVIE